MGNGTDRSTPSGFRLFSSVLSDRQRRANGWAASERVSGRGRPSDAPPPPPKGNPQPPTVR